MLFPLVTYRCLHSPSQSQVFFYWFIYLVWHVPAFEAIAQMGCLPLSVDEIQRIAVWLEVEVKEEISCWEEIHDSGAHCLQLFLELIHLIMILVKQLLCIEKGNFFFFGT